MPLLKINRHDFIQAVQTDLFMTGGGWYLDVQTGKILMEVDGAEGLE